jgi:hypothetical protein
VILLTNLAHHVYTCKYGNFLYNTDKERVDKQNNLNTVSIWTEIFANRDVYTNPYYYPEAANCKKNRVIYPNFAGYKIRLWEEYFLKYHVPMINLGKWTYISDANHSHGQPISSGFEYFDDVKRKDNEIIKEKEKVINELESMIADICENLIDKTAFESLTPSTREKIEKKYDVIKHKICDFEIIDKKDKEK